MRTGVKKRVYGPDMKLMNKTAIALVIATLGLSGCTTGIGDTIYSGYVVDKQALDLIPVGSSREQVMLSMGTPSTTATFDNEVFYYISQVRRRSAAFMKPRVVDQTVVAVYFNKDGVVDRRASYTMQDGKVFDTISRTTPTGGKDLTFLQQLLTGGSGPGAAAAAARNMFQQAQP